jgi:predicted P-loop ATPase
VRAVRELIVSRFISDPGKENVQDALERLCEKYRFDPICDYLDSLKWNGLPRVEKFLTTYFGAEDSPLNRSF